MRSLYLRKCNFAETFNVLLIRQCIYFQTATISQVQCLAQIPTEQGDEVYYIEYLSARARATAIFNH